ncbi:hypothetical protein EV183_004911 [Coemansia sp. RSA 2336]|nr:hypothetical protein EV183_004911 [Coemansia sp. RSA 2336]
MPNSRTFPRLRSSPTTAKDSGRPADIRTFAYDAASYRSLPHTPHTRRSPLVLGPRSIWCACRRDRQGRIYSILKARSAKDSHSGHAAMQQQSESVIETLSPKELPKVIRMRAREIAWMLGQRTKPKTVVLSQLANALRTTMLDEDDVVADAVLAAERAGYMPDAGEQSADFEAIQEIISLRHTLRLLLRMQLEHPEAGVRKNIDDIMARINSAKKTLKVPVPQPLATGPSFFFPAAKFALSAQQHLADGLEMDEDSFSSSSDEFSDYGDDGGHAAGTETAAEAAQRINASAVAAAAAIRGGLAGSSDQEATRAAHIMWVRKYTETMRDQWLNGAPHLFQLLNPLPQCGFALSSTLATVFNVSRSSIREPEAHYLFAAGAAQVGCYPLVCFAESRVMAACYDDDGDVYEEWLSRGISAAGTKTQLLAHFGQMLVSRPWSVTAQDVSRFVDEYVRLHMETPAHYMGRQRGDSSSVMPSPRHAVHRSLSTSVVSGVARSVPSMGSDFARRSIEENAIRDLLHAMVVMTVAHGLSSFALACGLTPDLDIPAGSYFAQIDGLVPVEQGSGLSYIEPLPAADGIERRPQPHLSAELVEQAESNTVDLINRLQQPAFHEHAFYDSQQQQQPPTSADTLSLQSQFQTSMLRHIGDSRSSAYIHSLSTIPDPLTSKAPQFAAYQQMRMQRLSRYKLPLYEQQKARYAEYEAPGAINDGSAPNTASPLEMAHRMDAIQTSKASSEPGKMSLSQPATAYVKPAPIHLSQCEELRWDAVSSYLQRQLSMNEDHMGAEVQAARGLVGRPFAENRWEPAMDSTPGVYSHENSNAPVTSEGGKPEWTQSPEPMGAASGASLMPKSYSLTNVLALPGSSARYSGDSQQRSRAVDVRRFHDAVWHFTLSLFHIYEEFYFYNKFKEDATPEPSQMEAGAIPVSSPEAAGIPMDVDEDEAFGQSRSNSSQQFSRWITDELKEHIRTVVRNPAAVTALTAQPPVAAALNLSVEEMVHVNLLVSLARRQAEIVYVIRAVREFEAQTD